MHGTMPTTTPARRADSGWTPVWRFATAHFTVRVETQGETGDPADDGLEEYVDEIHRGEVLWFTARGVVYDAAAAELGEHVVGGYARYSIAEFLAGDRSDLVSQAISAARDAIAWRRTACAELLRQYAAIKVA
jgi:hypothetical protein